MEKTVRPRVPRRGPVPGASALKVCLFSYHAYDVVRSPENIAGGMELQLLLLARSLKEKGVEVEILVGDSGQADVATEGGYIFRRVLTNRTRNPLQKLWFFIDAIRASRAEIILDRGSSRITGMLYLTSRILRMKFILAVASDVNLDRESADPSFRRTWERWLYRKAVAGADAIVLQKKQQDAILKLNYGRAGVVICSLLLFEPASQQAAGRSHGNVVWISNLHAYKQPLMFIDLARRMPDVPFVMVGGSREATLSEEILQKSRAVPNLEYRGFVPQREIPGILESACILVNTTVVDGKYEEGFPNTFLQAWSFGVPVVSLISDPDEMISAHGLGRCSHTFEQLVQDITFFVLNEEARQEVSRRCIAYVADEFDRDRTISEYMKLFETVAGGS
jgi:glycosyltransferase involved in cell wall biosynthesis